LTPGLEILNHYGPAETTVGALTHRISPGDRERFPLGPPIGRPLAGTRLYIVDKHGGPVPVGAAGELWIGGGGVSRGYRNLPDLTAERFLADPFRRGAEGRVYRTGDRARYARDGSVLFLGRDDDQVKIRGFRVELGEVKACLERHPKVSAAAVLARQDPLGVKRLVAYVAPRDGAAPEAAELRAHVKANLPDYMTPSAFVPVAAIPLTANGKVDRRALPDPGFDRDALREAYVPPRTPAEEVLVKIWCDVLRIERVGVHDNFFELGGESILSIQIVSRANQAGVRLKPRDVFERPTIAELAAASGELEARQAEQGAVSGEVPLTPIQRRYFDADLANPAHYNHALLFAAGKRLDSEVLRKALTALEAHHDVLRARYERSAEGWRQRIEPPAARDPLEAHDLSSLTPAKAKSELEALCAEAQRRLDLVRGPLWRAVHFRLPGGEERLLLAIHHLAVDGVSWRLLVEDLTQACAELEAGRAASLPPKTSSFKAWAEHLTARSAEAPTLKSAPWWVARLEGGAAAIPLDREAAPGVNIAANAEFLDVSLDEALTAQLLREPPRAYRAQIHEVLLTALARAFEPWTGSPRIAVDLEGHGREDLFDDLDISRTVGWFTSIHPVVLDLAGAAAPGDALCAVKETLRAVPHRGLDYGLLRRLSPETEDVRRLRALAPPSVGFNYLGHFEESVKRGGLLTIAPEFPGAAMDPANPRRYLFDVGGSIRGGRLHLTWTYCAKLHRRSTVEALAKRALEALAEIARHCASPGAGRRTPSDFPLADLRQEELTRLEARYAEAGLEDVYPMSPLQRGMVFHSLAEPGSPTYVTQLALTLHGDLSAGDFRTAWQAALDANPILRTAFVTGPHAMHQVVCRKPKLRWAHEDWSATPPDEQRARLERQALDDRAAGFDLADPPLMRLRLLRLAKDRHRFLWTHHHALLDGWSLPLLVREVFQAYTSRGKRPLEPRRPFVEYIRWLSRQDPQRAEKHWRAVLSDFGEPTPLPWSGVKPDAGAAPARGVLGEDLSPAATATLTALARREHVTLNTIVQGAWALLLARHAGLDDVLFGVTVSGRPPDLPGVETMLGLFINTLPLRVKVDDAPLVKYLAAVQAQLVELQQLQSSPLYEVQGFAPGRGGRPLFESLVVFENYPIAVSEPVESSGLRIEDAVDVSHATYPLALVVQPRQALHFELRYDARRFDAASIRRVLAHLRTLLEAMGARPEARLPQLQVLGEEERRRQVETWNLTLTDYPRDATVRPSSKHARARRPARRPPCTARRRSRTPTSTRARTASRRPSARAASSPGTWSPWASSAASPWWRPSSES
jgi:non-ribosomal peptide synthase protein (TIGR01720 family)